MKAFTHAALVSVGIIVIVAVLTLVAKTFVDNLATEPVEPQSNLEQLTESFSPPELVCQQLFGDARRYKTAEPQVECAADRDGHFFWQDKKDNGDWIVFYYNQYATSRTGFKFTTNPEEVKVTFKDLQGNEASAVVEIVSDYQACVTSNRCYRVNGV